MPKAIHTKAQMRKKAKSIREAREKRIATQARVEMKLTKLDEEILSRVHVPRYELRVRDLSDEGRNESISLVDALFSMNVDNRGNIWTSIETLKRMIAGMKPEGESFVITVGVRYKHPNAP